MENFAELVDLSFSRDGRLILDHISLQIPKGKVTAILGPSGTGKTTLLRLISGQLKPDSGDVIVDGLSVPSLSRNDLFTLRKRLSLLFQTGALFTDMSVFENVAFSLREHTRLPEHMIRDLVLLRLQSVGLRGAAHHMPSELSGGMARRVALARSLALDPELIMYDEPFTGQDPISMAVLVKLIRNVNDLLSLTSVLVSHDVEEALSIADQVYVLSHGRLIGEGTPEHVRQTDSPELKQFLFGHVDGPVSFHYPSKPLAQEVLPL
ncbi:MAG: ATP-binding cassette domain-containing protein [Bermanella sp.]